jgi:hypothetical protein
MLLQLRLNPSLEMGFKREVRTQIGRGSDAIWPPPTFRKDE